MILRIWHGYTKKENALAYETLLRDKIFPYIADKNVSGYRKIELVRRELAEEFEFITLMLFDSLQDIVAFAGPSYETAVVLPEAHALLSRYDASSQHYEVLDSRVY